MGKGEFCDQVGVLCMARDVENELEFWRYILSAIFSGSSVFPPRLVVGISVFYSGIMERSKQQLRVIVLTARGVNWLPSLLQISSAPWWSLNPQ